MAIQTDKPQGVDSAQSKLNNVAEKAAKKATSKVAKKATVERKMFLSKLKTNFKKEGIKQLISASTKSLLSAVIAPAIAIILIIFSFFSITTILRTFVLGKGDIEAVDGDVKIDLDVSSITSSVENTVKEAFDNIKKDEKTSKTIGNYIKDECGYDLDTGGLFDWFKNDVVDSEDGYDIQTDRYNIQVVFEPSIDVIAKNVAAYVTAVDSTLMYYANDDEYNQGKVDKGVKIDEDGNVKIDEKALSDMPSDKDMYENINGELQLKDNVKGYIDKMEPDDIKEGTDAFEKKIRDRASEFFMIEDDTQVWEDLGNVNLYKTKIPHTESHTACVLSYSGGEKEAPQENCDKHIGGSSYGYVEKTYTETVWLDGYAGKIIVPIYFDVTSYRQDELEAKADELIGKGKCMFEDNVLEKQYSSTCTEEEASEAVNGLLFHNVDSNMSVYGVDETYYGMLLGGAAGYDGVVAYKGELDWPSLAGKYSRYSRVAEMVWGKAKDYHDKGKIGGSTTNPVGGCTYFAQLWFYEVYGKNSSGPSLSGSGNGQQFAQVVIDTYPHEFELGREPAPGGLLSVRYVTGKYAGLGHIICIDEVEYTNAAHTEGYVIFSDGNYDGKGGVRIREKMSLKDFKSNWNGQYIYANPIRQ